MEKFNGMEANACLEQITLKCNSCAMLYFCREFYRSVVLKIYYVTGEMVIVVENNYSDSKLNGIVITIK